MFEKLNEELIEIKAQMWEKQKLENRRGQLREEIQKLNKKLYDLEYEMKMEKLDVEELEKMSLSTLIYILIGSKEKKLKKETEEYIRAKIKYDECNNLLEESKLEEDKLSSELMNIRYSEERYIEIKAFKEKVLMESENPSKVKLIEITEELEEAKEEQREYSEAISAGRTVLFELGKLIDSLDRASTWGTVDILGGGIISTAVKHSHIDEAKEVAYRVNKYMGQFKRELKDIRINTNMEVNLTSFESFGDYFFDGFFVDFLVQNKIKDSLDRATSLKRKLHVLVSDMETKMKELDTKVQRLISKRNNFIEDLN